MTSRGAAQAQYTPGPWLVDGSHIYAPDKQIIAQVHNPGSKEADYPLIANRNLMASAPELVEALQQIVDIGKRDLTNPKYDGYFETAIAVLLKARGGK